MKYRTIAAYCGKDLYGGDVWLPLVNEDQDGTLRDSVSWDSDWERVPETRRGDVAALHAKAVELFGPALETPKKRLPRIERRDALLALAEKVSDWVDAQNRAKAK